MEAMVTGAGFWKDRRVFLTGHTGFKGAWMALWLARLGAHVTGYALAPTQPSLFELAGVARCLRSEIADVTDPAVLSASIAAAKPEVVFHLAAQSLVREGYADPVRTYATNVMGTVHLLEACRRVPEVRAVVVVTSDKCYDNREWVWGYRECDPMGGRDPYSSSKGCAELVADAFRRSFFAGTADAQIATARAGNVIGGGDFATDRLLPDLLRAFASGGAASIRNPASVRPWQHVLEPLSGYLLLAERLVTERERFAGGWNFGPDPADARPVEWIADGLQDRWGEGARWQRDTSVQPHEAALLSLDCSKARRELQWRPRIGLDTALDWVVEWHRAYLAGKDMMAATLDQIARFESLPEERA